MSFITWQMRRLDYNFSNISAGSLFAGQVSIFPDTYSIMGRISICNEVAKSVIDQWTLNAKPMPAKKALCDDEDEVDNDEDDDEYDV